MTTLSANSGRDMATVGEIDLPVIASDIIYEGAAVGENASGYMRPLVAGDPFVGFAVRKVDNSGGSAGDENVRLRQVGQVKLNITSLAITDMQALVYASDDDTFTLTKGANSLIGRVVRFISTGVCIVAFDAQKSGGSIAALTDSSGGTATGTIAAIGATYDQDEVRDSVASLAAKVNLLLNRSA